MAVNHYRDPSVQLSPLAPLSPAGSDEINFSQSYLPKVSHFSFEYPEDATVTVSLSSNCEPVLVAGFVDSIRGIITSGSNLLNNTRELGERIRQDFLNNPVVETATRTAGTAWNMIQDIPEGVAGNIENIGGMVANPRRTITEVRNLIEQGMRAPGQTARAIFTDVARYVISNTPGLDPRTSENIRNNGRFRRLDTGDIILEVPGSDIIVNVPDTRFPGRSFEIGIRRDNGRIEWSPDGGTVQRFNGRDVIVTPDRRRLLASDGWRVPLANGQWGPRIPNGVPAELTVGDSRNLGIIERMADGRTIFHQTDHTFRLHNQGEGYSQPWSSTSYRPIILGGELYSQHLATGTLIQANRENTGTIRFRNPDNSYSSPIEGTFVLNRLQNGETLPGVRISWNEVELIHLPDGRIRFVGPNSISQPFFAQPVTIPSLSGTQEVSGLQVAFDNDKFFVGNGGVRMLRPDGTYSQPVSGTLTILDGAMYVDLDSSLLTGGQRVLVRPGGEGPSIRISSVPDVNGNRHWGPNIDGQLISVNGQPALQSESVPQVAMVVNTDGSIGWSLKHFSDDGREVWSPFFAGRVALWNDRVVIDSGKFIVIDDQVYDKEKNKFFAIEDVTRINYSPETGWQSIQSEIQRGWLLGRLEGQTLESTSTDPGLIELSLRHVPLPGYLAGLTPAQRAAFDLSRLCAGAVHSPILEFGYRKVPIATIADLTIARLLVDPDVYTEEIGRPIEDIFFPELVSSALGPVTAKLGGLEPIVLSQVSRLVPLGTDVMLSFSENMFPTRPTQPEEPEPEEAIDSIQPLSINPQAPVPPTKQSQI